VSAPAPLIAVPNVSEGRDPLVLATIGDALATAGARVLDVHSDPDHHRSVFTLAAAPGTLSDALIAAAREVVRLVDVRAHPGIHPHVGALDVAPIVYVDADRRGAAVAEALVLADRLGDELQLPVFLYGALGEGRTRAEIRRGGLTALTERMRTHELRPDYGPPEPHPTAGAVLVAARPPLIAFNLELAPPATLDDAKRIAADIREGGAHGLPGLRAIGLTLAARENVAQVSMNIEDHLALPLKTVVEAVAAHAPVAEAEVIGLPPEAAFAGFPADLPVRNRRTLEQALAEHPPVR
jgi:glutamate formiminotransferase/glutamate formiminotransferase/formiminotetrahydrofolate cyclodeaminase